MELKPYGPVEQAIEKSIQSEALKPLRSKSFLWGVLTVIAVGGAVWVAVVVYKRNAQQDNKKDPSETS